jgi:hypothetical protein
LPYIDGFRMFVGFDAEFALLWMIGLLPYKSDLIFLNIEGSNRFPT